MAGYSVSVNITDTDFSEIGTPLNPIPTKDAKPPKDIKDRYNDYCNEASTAKASCLSSLARKVPEIMDYTNHSFVLKFDYEKENSKTYKFLGMDIDENYDAVIKLGSGHVVVHHMFDRDLIKVYIENRTRYSSLSSDERKICSDMVDKLSEGDVRTLSTALKMGSSYSLKSKDGYTGPMAWENLLSIISKSIMGMGSEASLEFRSILLNLVHQKKIEQTNVKANSSVDMSGVIVSAILDSWREISDIYSSIYTSLACLDIWSDLDKSLVGNDMFLSKMRKCLSVKDNSTGELSGEMISFSGVSKNSSTLDDNVIRTYSANALAKVSDAIFSGNMLNAGSFDVDDLLLGFVDTDGIDDVYSINTDELQAMSVLDSLQYIDEDASLCKDSYNMNDPDERGLFVKSAIRSYERNFKEFKPANNYDVTEAMAEIIDRGDVSSEKIVPIAVATDDTDGTVVTSSEEEISSDKVRKDLLKILKLVYKSTSKILAGF